MFVPASPSPVPNRRDIYGVIGGLYPAYTTPFTYRVAGRHLATAGHGGSDDDPGLDYTGSHAYATPYLYT